MHLAAAVGTPLVAIFGSTSPELTGPVFSPTAQMVAPTTCHAPLVSGANARLICAA